MTNRDHANRRLLVQNVVVDSIGRNWQNVCLKLIALDAFDHGRPVGKSLQQSMASRSFWINDAAFWGESCAAYSKISFKSEAARGEMIMW
jgi:hypothetical protein